MHNTAVIDKKPMLSTKDLINNLKSKNIKFNYMSESEALSYLDNINNYSVIKPYLSNFEKYPSPAGKYEGMYIDLDFAYLVDLIRIDYELRIILFKMTINIERHLKLRILNLIKNIKKEDGYRVVNLYLDDDYNGSGRLHNRIYSKTSNSKYNDIITRYGNYKQKLENIPIWELFEVITFGELVNFYDFFINKYNLNRKQEIYVFTEIVKLRNSVCHNNALLSNLTDKDNGHMYNYSVVNFLDGCGIGERQRNKKLKNSVIRQITYTIYMFNKIVTDKDVKKEIIEELQIFFLKECYFTESII